MYVKRRFHQIAIEDENLMKSKKDVKRLLERIAVKKPDNQMFAIQKLREVQNYQGSSEAYLQEMLKSLNFQEGIKELKEIID